LRLALLASLDDTVATSRAETVRGAIRVECRLALLGALDETVAALSQATGVGAVRVARRLALLAGIDSTIAASSGRFAVTRGTGRDEQEGSDT
jgi:hypothetical protein